VIVGSHREKQNHEDSSLQRSYKQGARDEDENISEKIN
jgi:hypothetical protein